MGLVSDAAELYRRYHHMVYRYLVRLSGSPDAAEELLQETFYRAIRGAAGYRGQASPATWLCAIARNLYMNQSRRWQRERASRRDVQWDELPDPAGDPEQAAVRTELQRHIAQTMAALPEVQRVALLLRDADGLPYEAIADMLGLSLSNVKVTIHRARARFRSLYTNGSESDVDPR